MGCLDARARNGDNEAKEGPATRCLVGSSINQMKLLESTAGPSRRVDTNELERRVNETLGAVSSDADPNVEPPKGYPVVGASL